MDDIPVSGEAELLEQLKKLKLENTKLSRELRMTSGFLQKVRLTVEAKDVLGSVLAAANVKQRTYTDMLLERCPNIIILLDDVGRFVLFTKTFLDITGLPNDDYIMDRTYQEIFTPLLTEDRRDLLFGAINRVVTQREAVELNDYFDFGKTGNPRYYSIDFTIVEGKMGGNVGISAGVLAVFNDLTDFMREKERSEIANSAKSDFLAAMSHEIRTPLNAILGMAEILSRSELNEQQRKYMSDIRKSSHSLLAIINDILDFSKIEAGKLDILNADFNLLGLLDNLKAMFIPLFEAKSIEFQVELAADIPNVINSDENRLRQILTNLLSNALKYTVEGHVEFKARLLDHDTLRFDIADTGMGIREQDRQKLFLPFEQLDTRKNKNVVGTGLGLAISRNLCEMMGGAMYVNSAYGQGSTFSVEIPYSSGEGDGFFQNEHPNAIEFTAPGSKVLVVDDIEINLTVAKAMLEIFGIDADVTASGADAIDMAKQKKYDIIFMDQMMPIMDGIEATRLIRDMGGERSQIPIIALTANAINGVEQMFLSNGFDGFLAKPLELDTLGACLIKWLPGELIIKE